MLTLTRVVSQGSFGTAFRGSSSLRLGAIAHCSHIELKQHRASLNKILNRFELVKRTLEYTDLEAA